MEAANARGELFGEEEEEAGYEEPLYEEDEEDYGYSGASHAQLREIFGPDLQTVFDILAGRRRRELGARAAEEETTEPAEPPSPAPRRSAELDVPERLQDTLLQRDYTAAVLLANAEAHLSGEQLHVAPHADGGPSEEYLNEEARWITRSLREFSARAPLPLDRKAADTDHGLFDAFPLTDLFSEKRQRERYDLVFKKSGFDPERDEDDAGDGGNFGLNVASGPRFFPREKSIEQDIHEKVLRCLDMLLVEKVDVPFICAHRAHLLFPPLTPDAVYKIRELDEEYWRLQEFKRFALRELGSSGRTEEWLHRKILQSLDEAELQDLVSYIHASSTNARITGAAAPGSSSVKRRRALLSPEQVFHKYFTDTGIRNAWASAFQDPSEVSRMVRETINDAAVDMDIEDNYAATQSRPPAPPALVQMQFNDFGASTPDDASNRAVLARWIESLVKDAELALNPEQTLDLIIRFEAKHLAMHPEFKATVRRWYYKEASITTLTTLRGERILDAGNSNWIPCRLFNKPLEQLGARSDNNMSDEDQRRLADVSCPWERQRMKLEIEDDINSHREYGLLIDEAEKDGLVTVVLHPLTRVDNDQLPWQRPGKNAADDEVTNYRLRWENGDGEYPNEKQRLEFVANQDVHKTDAFIQRVINAMVSVEDSPPAWAWFISQIVRTAIEKELVRDIRVELRKELLAGSQQYVQHVCEARLLLQLSMRYRLTEEPNGVFLDFPTMANNELDDMIDVTVTGGANAAATDADLAANAVVSLSPLVYSLVIGGDGATARGSPVYLIMANRQGLLSKTMTFNGLLEYAAGEHEAARPREFENLLLSMKTRPNVIAIPLCSSLAVDLYNYIDGLASNRFRSSKRAWKTVLVPAAACQLSAAVKSQQSAFKQHSIDTLVGLSAIHYAVDPVYELTTLWDEKETCPLLSLPLHYLQAKVGVQKRLSGLKYCLIRAVNMIGVYPNRLRVLNYMTSALQFVSGLGPRKAAALMTSMQQPLAARETLLGLGVGAHTYLSCASFFRIPVHDDIYNDRYAEVDPLEDTRIHPVEEYATARKMCRDAQDEEETRFDPKMLEETLEDLDLEAYAYILGEGGRERMLPRLEWLKDEMCHPYHDPRIQVANLSHGAMLKYLMNDETKCRPTALLQLMVNSLSPPSMTLVPSNVRASLLDGNEIQMTKGQIVRVRLSFFDEPDLAAVVACASSNIADVFERRGAHLAHDPSTLSPLVSEDIMVARQNKGRRQMSGGESPVSRRIQHPALSTLGHRNLLIWLSKQALEGSLSQRCKFRIGSQKNNLILYIAVHAQPFRFKALPIEERDVPADGRSIGRQLILSGVGTFSSLDELIARPCTSFLTFVGDVVANEKFQNNVTPEALGEKLEVSAPGKVEWALCFDAQNDAHRLAERFQIVTVSMSSRTGQKRVIRDTLTVTHQGFRIWNQPSTTLQGMLSWYKTKGFTNRDMYKSAASTHHSSQPEFR